MKVYSDEEAGIRYRHTREEGMYDWCHTCQCAWPCDTGVMLAKYDDLQKALKIIHGTLTELMAGAFAPASSRGNYAITSAIDTAADALSHVLNP